jgi:hypothetical protein
VSPMNRKQTVDNEPTTSATADTATRLVVVDAPTLLDGMPELWRILVAIERCRMGDGEVSRGPWIGIGHDVEGGHDPRTCSVCTGYACGVLVTRSSRLDRRLVCALPDDDVRPGTIETEYLS